MKHRKKIAASGGSRPNSDINVTPLVDVVLVMLIIFMVVTPLIEKDIEVKVPDTEKSEDPADVPPGQIVVGLTPAGELTINLAKISDIEYVEKLKRMLAAKAKGDRLVFFMPDDKVNYGKLISALDGARQAGAETLGMMTEELPVPGAQAPEGIAPEGTTPASTTP